MADIFYDIDSDTMCSMCYAEFLDVEDLKLHITQYHLNATNKNRYCKLCSAIFASVDALALHFRNEHLCALKSCKYCTKLYLNDDLLLLHEKKHKHSVSTTLLCCSQCDNIFNNKQELEKHEYDNHSDSDDGIMIQHCFASLSSLINMNIRRFFEVTHGNFLYICCVCDFQTSECSLYVQHLKNQRCTSLACDDCCNIFRRKFSLRQHCKRHMQNNKSVQRKQCLKCTDYYKSSELKDHLRKCVIIKCKHCSLRFNSVTDLASHITVHSKNSSMLFITCRYCKKPVIGENALEKHIERTHKPELHLYKYDCNYCNIVFKHPKLLFAHFFTNHKDIQPYTCRICNKKFRLRKKFSLHIKLDHNSVGFVEFEDNFHVYFTDKKSVSSKNNIKIQENFVDDYKLNRKSDITEDSTNEKLKSLSADTDNEESIVLVDEASSMQADEIDILKPFRSEEDTLNKIEKSPNGKHLIPENTKNIISVIDPIAKYDTDKTTDVLEDAVSKDNKLIDNEKNLAIENLEDEIVFENVEVLEPDTNFSEDEIICEDERKKRKYRESRKSSPENNRSVDLDDSSDSDIPLAKLTTQIKKRRTKAPWNKGPLRLPTKNKFMCIKCNRNCYTFQNYERHMSLHKRNKQKSCIKCFNLFRTNEQLVAHIKSEHSTSKLTETLKKLLDQRKKHDNNEICVSETIGKQMQKVPATKNISQATITRVDDRLSVKKFIESFTPDTSDGNKSSTKISIRPVTAKRTQPLIKLTKFTPDRNSENLPTNGRPKLKVPTKYTDESKQEYNVSIKLVHCDLVPSSLNIRNDITITDINYNDYEHQKQEIPEMAHEIMLEETEVKNVKYIKKTVVLKDLLRYNNVRIGHLAPQAPYYKIVKIDDVLREEKAKKPTVPDKIVLPNGTKLVNVNPLAHLLNKKDIKEICRSSLNTKSHSKVQNFGEAIVKAMAVLDKPRKYPKKDE